MAFMTPELLTCVGIVCAIGLSSQGSAMASSASGSYLSRYNHSVASSPTTPSTTTGNLGSFLKPFIPIIISGVLAIYGFIVALLLCFKFASFESTPPDIGTGYKYLAAGLSVGLSCLWSGSGLAGYLMDYIYLYSPNACVNKSISSGTAAATRTGNTGSETDSVTVSSNSLVEPLLFGSSDQRKNAVVESMKEFPEPTIHFCMTLVYLEAIGLYGLIAALVLIGS